MTHTPTALDIRAAAKRLAHSHAEAQAHERHLYDYHATPEERAAATHWRDTAIADGDAWLDIWDRTTYPNTQRNGVYRAVRIYTLAAARHAQTTERS